MYLWPTIICGLMTLGIPVALRYQARRGTNDSKDLLSTALIISVSLGVVAVVVGYVFIPLWLSHYSPKVVRFSQLMMLFAPQIMFQYVSQAYLEARGEFTRSNRFALSAADVNGRGINRARCRPLVNPGGCRIGVLHTVRARLDRDGISFAKIDTYSAKLWRE